MKIQVNNIWHETLSFPSNIRNEPVFLELPRQQGWLTGHGDGTCTELGGLQSRGDHPKCQSLWTAHLSPPYPPEAVCPAPPRPPEGCSHPAMARAPGLLSTAVPVSRVSPRQPAHVRLLLPLCPQSSRQNPCTSLLLRAWNPATHPRPLTSRSPLCCVLLHHPFPEEFSPLAWGRFPTPIYLTDVALLDVSPSRDLGTSFPFVSPATGHKSALKEWRTFLIDCGGEGAVGSGKSRQVLQAEGARTTAEVCCVQAMACGQGGGCSLGSGGRMWGQEA